jgi:iron complex outermembrane receptor protein
MDFSFSGRVNLGNYMYNNLNSNSFYNRLYNSSGFLTNITTSVNQTQFSSPQYFSDYYIQNASFFRMDYMSLGYSLNTLWKAKLKIHFGITAQNVFVLTRYEGQDPESVTGIENYNYPRCRTISLELNVGF